MQCPNALAPNEAPVKCIETSGEGPSLVRSLNGHKIILELVNYGVYMIPILKVRQQKCPYYLPSHLGWTSVLASYQYS